MQTVIVIIHLVVVLTMTGLVLLQKSEGGGLGMGNSGGFLTSRGTANVLTRSTAILAAVFFATSLILSIMAGLNRNQRSILDTGAPNGATIPAGAPASIPLGSSRIPGNGQGAPAPPSSTAPASSANAPPAAPAPAPAEPQVPQSR